MSNNVEGPRPKDSLADAVFVYSSLIIASAIGFGEYFIAQKLEIQDYFDSDNHGTYPLVAAISAAFIPGVYLGFKLGNKVSPGFDKRLRPHNY